MTFISISLWDHVTAAHPKRCVLMLIKHRSDNAALCVEACAHTHIHAHTEAHGAQKEDNSGKTKIVTWNEEKTLFADRSPQNCGGLKCHLQLLSFSRVRFGASSSEGPGWVARCEI